MTTRARRALLALGLALAGPAGAQSPRAAPDTLRLAVRFDTLLDLRAVIDRALATNPAVAQGEALLRTTRSEVRVANGAFLPTLSASSTAMQSDQTTSGSGTASAVSAGLASSLDLFTGGRRGADRARARADYGYAEAVDVTQRFAVTLVAERAYYDALRATELLEVAGARLTRAEQGLKYAQDRVRAGTATRSDELRARLELTTARQQQLAAGDTLLTAGYALGRLVGADGPVGARALESLDPQPLALGDSELVRFAIERAPAVRASEAQATATDAAVRAARSLYLPGLRLTGGYNVASQTTVLGATRPGWQLLLGTSYPLFNGFQREDAVARATAAADVARVQALDARRQVRGEAARLLGALRFARENITLAGEAVAAAQEDLRVQTQRYRAGISTALDQLTSELAVTQAELGLVAARYNYQTTRASLEALVGRTL